MYPSNEEFTTALVPLPQFRTSLIDNETMAQLIAQPSPRDLLPPLLACLPASFASPRPPPALLSLLSPILRQRVQLLASSNSVSESWLPLLCWDRQRAAKLPQIVQSIQLEPHPVSGEFEIDDVRATGYRRLDKETLHARFELDQFGLLPIYLWCVNDEAGGGTGWRLAEMRALEDLDDGTEWFGSIEEANQGAGARGAGTNGINGHAEPVLAGEGDADEDGDDDSYWAAYDRTPGRTPAKRSPAPNTGRQSSIQLPTTSELEYFARYAAEVQPAMDPHDPDEEDAAAAAGGSTLNGDSITRGMPAPQPEVETAETTDLGSLSRDSAIPAPLQPNGHFESGRDRTSEYL
ncbi:hypothetical protein H2201_000546 [Coniosporium apollinis]|uniref:Uncharacterized protein n=1 Tax=Coniosporium apollinis TaxID=61459 RepID=A0ABQ9P3M6_9PEZI|nr:hypothetical protein H2201_000546 [Coniosporium apollinis]